MSHLATRAAACLALFCPLTALAGQPANVEIYDRTAGQVLPVYWHDGERFVAGEPGHEYEIRIRNREYSRVLAVTSVDGVNVITGRTAAPDQGGYVLDPREGGTLVTSFYDWSDIHEAYEPMVDAIFPVISETNLRATLGILARVVAPGRSRPGA